MINNLKELNVLYIDDDKIACKNMEKTLSYFFKNVFIEHNGLNAIQTYKEENIHLLLVDYDMPVMNGLSFLQEIRIQDDTIPAVIISSYADQEKLLSAMSLKLVAYLIKPLEFDDLKKVLLLCVEWMKKYNLLKVEIAENCYYDFANKTIINSQKDILNLTNFEFKILEYLIKNKNKVVSFEQLFNILESQSSTKKSLTSIVYKINKKLSSSVIKNIKDVGYTIVG